MPPPLSTTTYLSPGRKKNETAILYTDRSASHPEASWWATPRTPHTALEDSGFARQPHSTSLVAAGGRGVLSAGVAASAGDGEPRRVNLANYTFTSRVAAHSACPSGQLPAVLTAP